MGESIGIFASILALFASIFPSFLEPILQPLLVLVSLNPSVIFEQKKGNWVVTQWSAAITIINYARHPLNLDDVGFILNNGERIMINPVFQHLDLPKTIPARDRASFNLQPNVLLQISTLGIQNMKYVYAEDRTLNVFKTKITGKQRTQLESIADSLRARPKETAKKGKSKGKR